MQLKYSDCHFSTNSAKCFKLPNTWVFELLRWGQGKDGVDALIFQNTETKRHTIIMEIFYFWVNKI